jgi:adenylate kinase
MNISRVFCIVLLSFLAIVSAVRNGRHFSLGRSATSSHAIDVMAMQKFIDVNDKSDFWYSILETEYPVIACSHEYQQIMKSKNDCGAFALESRARARPQALKIILMGAPSSGKGTQSHLIRDRYGLVHLSTGDMLREVVNLDPLNGIGAVVKRYMEEGALVPDAIITEIVLNRISQPDCKENGWILDGYPRTKGQAQSLNHLGLLPDVVIFLNVPDTELIERVVGRRTDPLTGKIYHMKFYPPPDDEIRYRLVCRSDDNVESMQHRLRHFRENVESVKDFYDDIFLEVNGMGTLEKVSASVFDTIDSLQLSRQEK